MTDVTYLVYRPHTPAVVELSANNPLYVVCKNDVCLLQVPNHLVALALSKRCGCCGQEKNCFGIASQDEIDRFNKI